MKSLPKVGWLLPVLCLLAVCVNLGIIWNVWALEFAISRAGESPSYVKLTLGSLFGLLPSIAAWLLYRWKVKWVRFVQIRRALGDEFELKHRTSFTLVMGLLTLLGALPIVLGVVAGLVILTALVSDWVSPELAPSLMALIIYALSGSTVWILLIAGSRFAVHSASVEKLRNEHLARKRSVLDKCESYCRESRNVKTRESRAELGLATLPIVRALDPKSVKRIEGLELYFDAVERTAELVDVVRRMKSVQTEHAKAHHRDRAREILKANPVTDEDLVLVEFTDSEHSREVFTLARLHALIDMDAAPAAVEEPQAPLVPANQPGPGIAAGPARWIAQGESVQVQGFTLPGGMLYVGEGLTSVSDEAKPEPALIDPTKRLDPSSPARSGRGMAYWPSFSEITPKQRAAYLDWLAEDRAIPGTYIGYVFLFFYGLERRLGFDLELKPDTVQEWLAIRSEVERLCELYGDNKSFSGFATSFLEWMDFNLAANGHSADAAISRRVVIGELASASRPIPGKVAFEWALTSEQFRWRAPAQRCPDEFRELFLLRYAETHGKGLTTSPNARRLAVQHKAASPSFSAPLTFELDLPDVEQDELFVARITELIERCHEELTPYSRRIQSGFELSAIGLLPRELGRSRGGEQSRRLIEECERALEGDGEAHLEAAQLIEFFPPARGSRWTKAEAVRIAQTIDRLGFGIEPDVRFAAPTPRAETTFELFRLPGDAPVSPSSEYVGAISLVQLTAAVVAADGELLSAEEQHFEERLEQTLSLSESERLRLRAHLRWRARERPSLSGMKARAEKLSAEQREDTARFLLSVAAADGNVSASEMAVLAKAYSLLGLDPDRVHSDVHAVALDPESKSGERPEGAELDLDEALVARKHHETLAVSRLLADIFDDEPEVEAAEVTPQADGVAGLDETHSALFHSLRVRDSWTRAEFESLSSAQGLLPDGALETLNETAYERFDSPLTEGDDPIEVIPETVQEFLK